MLIKPGRTRLVLLLALVASVPALAQDDQASASPQSANRVFEDYYAKVETQKRAHAARLQAIDQDYRASQAAFSAENVSRSKALSAANLDAHKTLSQEDLSSADRQAASRSLQEEDRERRAAHAEWRDTTSRKLRDDYRVARANQLAEHEARMKEILVARNASLATTRIVGLPMDSVTSEAGANPRDAASDSGREPTNDRPVQSADGIPDIRAAGNSDQQSSGSTVDTVKKGPAAPITSADSTDAPQASNQSHRADAPVLDESGENFEWKDGSRVRAVGANGEVGRINEKGDVVYPDGTTITHTGDQEVTIHRPDGTSTTKSAVKGAGWTTTGRHTTPDQSYGGSTSSVDVPQSGSDSDGTYFEWSDGSRAPGMGPSGAGKINSKGDIVYPDGTTIVHTGHRQVTVHRPNGTSVTHEADKAGKWSPVSKTNTSSYGAESGGSNSSDSGADDGNSDSSKDSTSDGDNDNDNEGDDSGSDDSADNDGSGEDGSGGDDGESADDSEGAEGDEKGNEFFGEGGQQRSSGPSDALQGVISRATGQSSEIETGVPEPCEDAEGFGVSQPQPGANGSCVPGHLPGVSEDNDEQTDPPDAGSSADAEDARRAGQTDIAGSISQPGLNEAGVPVEDLPSHTPLDQSPVVNPPEDQR